MHLFCTLLLCTAAPSPLRQLLFPVSPARFFSRFWERQPLLLRGEPRRAEWHGELFGWDAVDAVVARSRSVVDARAQRMLNLKDFFLVKRVRGDGGDYWSAKHTQQRVASLDYVHKAFDAGFTVVINRVEARSPAVSALCHDLRRELGFRCAANAYLSSSSGGKGGAQGFEAHMDWMEAIVLQLQGSKRWVCHGTAPGLALPRRGMVHKPSAREVALLPSLQPEGLGVRAVERGSSTVVETLPFGTSFELQPGDALYMPSGLVHEAVVAADTVPGSLHLTLGLEVDSAYTVEGALHEALAVSSSSGGAVRSRGERPAAVHVVLRAIATQHGGPAEDLSWILRRAVPAAQRFRRAKASRAAWAKLGRKVAAGLRVQAQSLSAVLNATAAVLRAVPLQCDALKADTCPPQLVTSVEYLARNPSSPTKEVGRALNALADVVSNATAWRVALRGVLRRLDQHNAAWAREQEQQLVRNTAENHAEL